eukprot:TRINITY_DN39127_c0_g1_i4.p2 TRINITY_DN39127_c0_g1~~TRINITY_DN39127_c0_g1_i4.p2  ORF type:complete len:190 (-),score=11.68 TRINITY_DN39127_c0_g1_i4:271-840(-)
MQCQSSVNLIRARNSFRLGSKRLSRNQQVGVKAALKVRDELKNFPDYYRKLKTQTGEQITIAQFQGQKPVVLFFYPKAGTPGCTAEACNFRDRYEEFTVVGAEVIGISGDSVEEQQQFANAQSLPFTLVADENNLVRQGFGVSGDLLGLLPGRQTFVIDKNGKCVLSFNDQFNATKHIEEALQALKRLQ